MRKYSWVVGAAMIMLVCTFPWGDLTREAHWERMAWIPFVSPPVRLKDIGLNVLMAVPLGLACGATGRRSAMVLAIVVALAAAGTGEWLQVHSLERFPATGDIVSNAIGAAAGALAWRGISRATLSGAVAEER